jgi:hypothetical protein
MLWLPAVAVEVVTVEAAATAEVEVTALVETQAVMVAATVVVKVAGAAVALPVVWAGLQAEEHPHIRRGKRCRRKAASPAIAGPRDMLQGIRCRPRVA